MVNSTQLLLTLTMISKYTDVAARAKRDQNGGFSPRIPWYHTKGNAVAADTLSSCELPFSGMESGVVPLPRSNLDFDFATVSISDQCDRNLCLQ